MVLCSWQELDVLHGGMENRDKIDAEWIYRCLDMYHRLKNSNNFFPALLSLVSFYLRSTRFTTEGVTALSIVQCCAHK